MRGRSLCLAAAVALVLPGAARAHTELEASRPADGDTLRAAPSEVWLLFTEPVESRLSEIRILGHGMNLLLSAQADTANAKAILAVLPAGLEQGSYRVTWRVVSADGHRVAGSFVFTVLSEPAEALPPPPPAATEQPPSGGPTSWPLGLLRGVATGLLLALAGALAMAAWIAPREGPAPALRGLAVAAPAVLVIHVLAWAAYVSSSGLDGAVLRSALGTLPGRIEALRLALAVLTVWALFLARRPGLAAAFAMIAVAASAGLGHAASRAPEWSIPAKAAHLIAAAVWIGGLLHLAGGGLRGPSALAQARRVSAVALTAVLVIAFTGVIQARLNLSQPADLARSTYGILVLAKVVGLAVLVAFGYRNRYRLIPAMAAGESGKALERSVRWEIVAMGAVVLVAGLLAYTPIPA